MDKYHPILLSLLITEDINFINEDIEQQIPFLVKDLQKIGLNDEGASKLISDLKQDFDDEYTPHIIRWIVNSSVIWPEDNDKVKQLFIEYEQVRSQNPIALKNLGKYYKFQDLVLDVDRIIRPEELKKQARVQKINLPGVTLAVDHGQYSIFKVTDVSSAVKLASGTKWCISNPRRAQYYLSQAPLYIILKDGKKYALMHLYEEQRSAFQDDSNTYVSQLKNVADVEIRPDIELLDLIERIPEVQSFKLEHPIHYTIKIAKRRNLEIEPEIIKNNDFVLLFRYAGVVGRVPEIESIILKSYPYTAFEYAINVIKVRWPEFEAKILHDKRFPVLAAKYATDVIEGRWPEAEQFISKDPLASLLYATNVIRGRWPEGEAAIMKVNAHASDYKAMVDYEDARAYVNNRKR
jgi:hypothetical protein